MEKSGKPLAKATVPKANKKVKNALASVYDGIKFRSQLEIFIYKALKAAGIPSDYEKKSYVLIDKCEYNDEKVRPITYKPDFVNEELGFLIEVKGIKTDAFVLRWKLFKRYLSINGPQLELFLPRNQKECLEVVELLKSKGYGDRV
jgi:hypothetical protein